MFNIKKKLNDILRTNNQFNRESWLKKRLKKIPKGARILDAGAGELQYKKYCSHLKYVSQDFAQYNGVGDNVGLQTDTWDQSQLDIISDITTIPEKDKSFDAIMCIEVFEHLPNPIKAIEEFSRLIKSNGNLIITAPFSSLTHFAPYHFYTGFNRYFYEKHLIENGFKIITINENGNYFDYLTQELLRVRSISKKYANKKINIFELSVIFLCVLILKHLSKKDKGSSELLTFGYHIHAIKK